MRKFKRSSETRSYRKTFIIATEGNKTEPQYFNQFNDDNINICCIPSNHNSAPEAVLLRMKKELKNNKLRPGDEAWLVVDKDQWQDETLNKLSIWSKQNESYGFAVSNPKFEYWLLLHFVESRSIDTPNKLNKTLA